MRLAMVDGGLNSMLTGELALRATRSDESTFETSDPGACGEVRKDWLRRRLTGPSLLIGGLVDE